MIQIYNPDNTEFDYNGDMILLPQEATVHVILGSTWEAEIVHPIDDEGRWAYIVENAVVKMPSFNGEQLWRIVSTEKTDSGVSAAMQPIFYDAANEVFLVDVRPTGKSGQEALDILMDDTKYSGESDIETPYTAYYEYKNLLEALNGDIDQSFVNRWGGEIIYDNFKVIINTEAGEDNGVEIRYGKNIPESGFTVTEDMSEVVTRIYPKGYDGVTMTDDGYVDSGHIDDYPTVRAATITYDYIYYTADMDEDDIAELEEDETNVLCATQAELDEALTEACEAEFDAGIDVPAVTIECDMVLLQNTEQYKDVEVLEEVSLGDTIYIVNSHIGFETTARAIELEYDSILQRITSVVIGDYEYDYFSESTKTASELLSSVNNLAASVGEFKTVITEELYAVYANIETLTAGYAEITELKATVATIEEAYIDEAYVATLLANYASITYLEANYINADTIEATYATIETLESTTASITALFSDYASISYLEANYVTTSTLAVDLAYIDETYIKSAEVTDLLADYITATQLYALTGTVEDLTATYLTVTGDETVEGDLTINGLLSAVYASIGTVAADYISANTAVINTIIADYISANTAEFYTIVANYISSNSADIESIVSSYIVTEYLTATGIESDTITVGDIFGLYATIDYVDSNYVTTTALAAEIASIEEAYITSATVTELLADYATVTELNAVSATINSLSSSYAEIDFSNVNVSNVVTEFVSDLLTAQGFLASSATIDTVSVTSYLTGVGIIADYITAGTLDCTNITVANLSVGVLTVDSINGYTLADSTVAASNLEELLVQILDAITTTDDEVAQALEDAGLATTAVEKVQEQLEEVVSIANGKSTTYFSDTAPSSSDFDLQENDIWFDTDDDNAMYKYDGTAWEKCEYGTSAIAASAITAELIASEAVTTAKIAAGAVTANEIAANTITAANILAGTITSSEIDTDSIATAVLSATYIQASTLSIGTDSDGNVIISDGKITASMIDAETITGDMIVSNSITATQIAAGTITSNEIAANTITASNIAAGTITATELASGSVTAEKISVSDLYALGATIGGFTIGSTAIYSSYNSFASYSSNIYIGSSGISLGTTFSVTYAGELTATSGTIGAFTLTSAGLYAYNSSYSSSYAGIYRPVTIYTSTIAFFAGATARTGTSAVFKVTYGGDLVASSATITGTIYASGGTIGGFTIGSSSIYSSYDSYASYSGNIYIGSSGISLGTAFAVTSAGALTASNATITGTIYASGGTIGGFTIGSSSIYTSYNSFATYSSNIYIGSSGISLGTVFSVTPAGYLTATSGLIGAFYLGSTALYTSSNSYGTVSNNIYIGTSGISLSTTFKVSAAGAITATSGTIGAITLSSTGLYAYNSSYSSSYAGIYRPSTITTSSYAFFAGATSAAGASAGFYVTYGGTMYASDAEISGTITTESGYYKSVLTSGNLCFYYNSTLMGTYGSTAWTSDSTVRGVRFGMEYYCDFMSFSRKTSASATDYTMYMYFDWSGDISGYADALILSVNAHFQSTPHFETAVYHYNANAIYFYTSGDSTTGGYLYMSSSDNISLTCSSGNLYVYSSGGSVSVYSTAGNASLYSSSGYTRIGCSGYATYIYGTVSYALTFANGYGVQGTDSSGNTYYICDIATSDICWLGTSSLPTYVRGSSIALNATVTHAYGAYFNNGYGLGFYDSAGSTYGYLLMSSSDVLTLNGNGNKVWVYSSAGTYIGNTSCDTYIWGYIKSSLAMTNGYGLCFYTTGSVWAGACYMNSSNNIFLYSGSYPVYVYGSTTYLGYGGTNTYIRGTTAFTGTVSMTYSCDIATNGYGIRLTDTDGELFYALSCGSTYGYVYVGNTSYVTYVRGSTIYMNGSAYSSDISVKNSITTMDDSYLDLIDHLTPRSFYYNWNSEDYCSGFIAQEVMEALEEVGITNDTLIRYNKEEGAYALDYNGFIPILVAAVKELRSEVAALQTELSALQSA